MVSADGTSLDAGAKSANSADPSPANEDAARDTGTVVVVPRPKGIDRTAIEFQPDSVEIEERPVPGGARWTLYVIVAGILAAITWAWLTKVDRVVEARGRSVTIVDPIVIQPLQSSTIREMRVRFGDRVRPGDVLAVLDGTFSEADVAKIEDGIRAHRAALQRLEAERSNAEWNPPVADRDRHVTEQYQLYTSRREEYRAKVSEIESEIAANEAERETYRVGMENSERKIELLAQIEAKSRVLVEEVVESELNLLQAQLQALEERAIFLNLRSRQEEVTRTLEKLKENLAAFKASWRTAIDVEAVETQRQLGQLEEELSKAKRLRELVELVVPTHLPNQDYVVFDVAEKTVGSVAVEDQPFIKLIPLDVPLEIEIEISSQNVGYLRLGEMARVKFDAFPYQKHGWLDGTLRTISEGSYLKEQAGGQVSYFRGRIGVAPDAELEAVPPGGLLPGMEVTAEIRVGERRVIDYLLYPLIRQWDSSLREP